MTLDYKNCKIHYTIRGKGTTVVLLHGFLENLEMWTDTEALLSKNHQVLCIDLLGHGKTDCLGYVHTMDDMAQSVSAVLEALSISEAHFIGHSMGGYVALAFAEKSPRHILGLCLMNSTFEADNEERRQLRTRAIQMAQTNYENLIHLSFSNLFAPESKITFKNEYNIALKFALQTPLQGYIAAQEGMKIRPNRFDVFNKIDGKKVIILGKKDTLISLTNIAQKISNTDIKFVSLSEGHMSHIENKQELFHAINHFVLED